MAYNLARRLTATDPRGTALTLSGVAAASLGRRLDRDNAEPKIAIYDAVVSTGFCLVHDRLAARG